MRPTAQTLRRLIPSLPMAQARRLAAVGGDFAISAFALPVTSEAYYLYWDEDCNWYLAQVAAALGPWRVVQYADEAPEGGYWL